MKRYSFLCLLFILFFTLKVNGQHIYPYRLYAYNLKEFNPAYTGFEDKHVFTSQILAEKLNGDIDGILNIRRSYENYFRKIGSGIGFSHEYEKMLFYRQQVFKLFYNYRIRFDENNALILGLNVTYDRTKYNHDVYNVVDQQDIVYMSMKLDPIVKVTEGAGIAFKGKTFFTGLSFHHFLNYYSEPWGHLSPVINFSAGNRFGTGKFQYTPSVFLLNRMSTYGNYKFYGLNNLFAYKDKFFLTGAIQSGNDRYFSLTTGVGIRILKKVDWHFVGYSHNFQEKNTRESQGTGKIRILRFETLFSLKL